MQRKHGFGPGIERYRLLAHARGIPFDSVVGLHPILYRNHINRNSVAEITRLTQLIRHSIEAAHLNAPKLGQCV